MKFKTVVWFLALCWIGGSDPGSASEHRNATHQSRVKPRVEARAKRPVRKGRSAEIPGATIYSLKSGVPQQTMGVTQDFSFSKFDPRLGILDSVKVWAQPELSYVIGYENLNSSMGGFGMHLYVDTKATFPAIPSLTYYAEAKNSVTVGPFDGLSDYSGVSGRTFADTWMLDSKTAQLADRAKLYESYVANTPAEEAKGSLSTYSVLVMQFTISANASSQASAGMDYEVTYDYHIPNCAKTYKYWSKHRSFNDWNGLTSLKFGNETLSQQEMLNVLDGKTPAGKRLSELKVSKDLRDDIKDVIDLAQNIIAVSLSIGDDSQFFWVQTDLNRALAFFNAVSIRTFAGLTGSAAQMSQVDDLNDDLKDYLKGPWGRRGRYCLKGKDDDRDCDDRD